METGVKGKKIFVGLSGGVDSAVTAALLREAGAEVVGVFIQGWYPPGMPCTWQDDRRDAMRVAAHLRIPFTTLDASQEYKKGVIEYLLAEYRAGRTPNPDIMCNREVKFGAFYQFAMSHGADYIATGHYAKIVDGRLYRGLDEQKDQSYFLWAVPKETFSKSLFPLGEMHKDKTRSLARRHRLPNASKKDSQGICFLGSISVEDFLRAEFGEEPGKVRSDTGQEIGMHDGAFLHTMGEKLSLANGPWYVSAKDIEENTLTVSRERHQPSRRTAVKLSAVNWLRQPGSEKLSAQYRYHGPRITGTLDTSASTFTPQTELPEPLACGQSLVVYAGDQCIGGGIIE